MPNEYSSSEEEIDAFMEFESLTMVLLLLIYDTAVVFADWLKHIEVWQNFPFLSIKIIWQS
jgi:hypothetical protein